MLRTCVSRCSTTRSSTSHSARSAASSCLSHWLTLLHRASHISAESDTAQAQTFSVLTLNALRSVALAVMSDITQIRTNELIAWTQHCGTRLSSSTSYSSDMADASLSGKRRTDVPFEETASALFWGLPRDVGSATDGEASRSADITVSPVRDVECLLVIWSVQVVMALWQPPDRLPRATAKEAESEAMRTVEDTLHLFRTALKDDVKPLVDFFWLPARQERQKKERSSSPSSASLPHAVIVPAMDEVALTTTQICYIWSTILFFSCMQLVEGGKTAGAGPSSENAASAAAAVGLVWVDHIRPSMTTLLIHAHQQHEQEQEHYVRRIERQRDALDRLCPGTASRQLPTAPLVLFFESLFKPTSVTSTSSHVRGEAQLSSSSSSLFAACHPHSLARRVYAEGHAPLWPSPLSFPRFRSSVQITMNSYQSMYSTFAEYREAQARAENTASLVSDADDAQLIARLDHQLTEIARQGGSRPLV